MTSAKGTLNSVYGLIESDWRLTEEGGFTWRVTVPPNTTATVYVPAKGGATVTEGTALPEKPDEAAAETDRKPAEEAEGIRFLRREEDAAVYEIGVGRYHFTVTKEGT